MSDTATDAEVEDVLSSIRRLVSADARGETSDDRYVLSSPVKDGRLVLTPAQRVDDTEALPDLGTEVEQTSTDPEPDQSAEHAFVDGENRASFGLSDPQGELVQDVHHEDFSIQEDEPSEVVDAFAQSDEPQSEPELAEMVEEGREADETPEAQDIFTVDDLGDIEARIAVFEDALAHQSGDWEPDGSNDEFMVSENVAPLPWQEAEEAEAQDAVSLDRGEISISVENEADVVEIDEAPVQEPVTSAVDDSPDEDQAVSQASDNSEAEDASALLEEEEVLDEETLHDMVVEIVRAELQSTLGIRITRTVRKLVRREIQQALNSRGL